MARAAVKQFFYNVQFLITGSQHITNSPPTGFSTGYPGKKFTVATF
jgi:hypothetical protein